MPTYMCPKCGREVEVPTSGSYTCRECNVPMVLFKKWTQAARLLYVNLNKAVQDETQANREYQEMADMARQVGVPIEDLLRDIARDEFGHAYKLRQFLQSNPIE